MIRRVLVGVILSAVVLFLATHDDLDPDRGQGHPACQEDDPCWDCSTMGNLICGTP